MFCFVLSFGLYAQKHRVIDLELQAVEYFDELEFSKSLLIYQELEELDSSLITADHYFNIGVCYMETYHYQKALTYLERAHSDEGHHHYYYAKALHLNYLLDDAIKQYKLYKNVLALEGQDIERVFEIDREIRYCLVAKQLVSKPEEVEISLLLSGINSKYDDYSPLVNSKDSIVYFTSDRYVGDKSHTHQHDGTYLDNIFSISLSLDSGQKAEQIEELNSKHDDACVAINHKGNQMIVFRSHKKNELNSSEGHLYWTGLVNGRWSKPQLLTVLKHSNSTEISACFSVNDSTIYFTSDMEGGFGGEDIYKTSIQSDGKWSKPINLGAAINSEYDEDSPFMHPNGKELYFVSNGNNSMGGYDVFVTELKGGGYTRPNNLGYPINTVGDDFGVFVTDSDELFFSDNRAWGVGETDVYKAQKEPKSSEQEVIGLVVDNLVGHSYQIAVYDDKGKLIKVVASDELTKKVLFFVSKELNVLELVVSQTGKVLLKTKIPLDGSVHELELFSD